MALMEWSDALSVGIPSIDEQHKKLVNMLNALQFAVEQGKEESTLQEIFQGLACYTEKHFSFEEQLLEEHNVSEMESHKREHEVLRNQLVTLQQRFDAGEAIISDVLIDFLKGWLKEHIQGTDQKFADQLRALQVQ